MNNFDAWSPYVELLSLYQIICGHLLHLTFHDTTPANLKLSDTSWCEAISEALQSWCEIFLKAMDVATAFFENAIQNFPPNPWEHLYLEHPMLAWWPVELSDPRRFYD